MRIIISNLGFLLAISVFVILIFKAISKKNSLGNTLSKVFMGAALVVIFFALNCNAPLLTMKSFCVCLEHIAIIWTLYFTLVFASDFCEYPYTKESNFFVIGILLLDSSLLITNPINKLMADVVLCQKLVFSVAAFVEKPVFYYHIFCMFFIVVIQLYVLIRKLIATSRYYRFKYVLLLIAYVIVIAPNLLYFMFDVEVFVFVRWIFGMGAGLVYYIAFISRPITLLGRLKSYVDDTISDAIIIYDASGAVLSINRSAKNLFAKEDWCDKHKLMERINCYEDSSDIPLLEIKNSIYEVVYNPVKDGKGNYVAATFVFHDVTEAERRFEKEHKAAIYDQVTKIYNRTGFIDTARKFMNKNKDEGRFVIVVSGINNFKGINSLYGTKIGDQVLKAIALKYIEISRNPEKETEMVYGRTAEGKFAALIPFDMVEELVNELSHFTVNIADDAEVHVEMSHGFTMLDDSVKGIDFYYERALLALGKCKNNLRSAVLEYSVDFEEDQHRQQMLLAEAHDAISHKEFFIELQPQIDIRNHTVIGAEALVRWNHPVFGRISPAEFVPLFEDNGYITYLDRFVWDQAASVAKEMEESGVYSGPISVNVSQKDIINTDVPSIFDGLAKKYQISPKRIHVEITESTCVNTPETLLYTMNRLRELGFEVEIDDFGSGYSSLNALMGLPFDVVKLDMMFMREKRNEKADVIISAITSMVHSLGAKVVVEGIETEDNLKAALELGGDIAQGYYYSKPISIEKFSEFVANFSKIDEK